MELAGHEPSSHTALVAGAHRILNPLPNHWDLTSSCSGNACMHTDTQILAGHRQVGLALDSAPYTTQDLMRRTWDTRLQNGCRSPQQAQLPLPEGIHKIEKPAGRSGNEILANDGGYLVASVQHVSNHEVPMQCCGERACWGWPGSKASSPNTKLK